MRIHPVLAFFLQTIIAGVVLVPTAAGIVVSLGAYEGGIQSIVVLLFACIVSVVTITMVTGAGLPLRVVPRFNDAWRRHAPLVLPGVLLGFAAVLAFSLVHLVNPFRRRVPREAPAPAAP